jgi:ferritin
VALTKVMQDALNTQIRSEFASAYTYLAMSAHCAAQSLNGFARWLRVQAQEEAGHAMKIYDYLEDRGGRVALQAVDRPPAEWNAPLDLFQDVLAHERKVTAEIDALYALALQEKDYASQAFLQWFVTEQIEEEKTATQVVETLRLVGDRREALIMVDRELGQRGAA